MLHVYAELILTSFGVLITCLCILLAVFLLIANGPLKPANSFLAGFLFLTAVDMIGWAAALLPTAWRELLPYRLPFAYLQMPLLYAYAVSLCFPRSEEHTSELQSLMRISYAVFCLKKKK